MILIQVAASPFQSFTSPHLGLRSNPLAEERRHSFESLFFFCEMYSISLMTLSKQHKKIMREITLLIALPNCWGLLPADLCSHAAGEVLDPPDL